MSEVAGGGVGGGSKLTLSRMVTSIWPSVGSSNKSFKITVLILRIFQGNPKAALLKINSLRVHSFIL